MTRPTNSRKIPPPLSANEFLPSLTCEIHRLHVSRAILRKPRHHRHLKHGHPSYRLGFEARNGSATLPVEDYFALWCRLKSLQIRNILQRQSRFTGFQQQSHFFAAVKKLVNILQIAPTRFRSLDIPIGPFLAWWRLFAVERESDIDIAERLRFRIEHTAE